MYKLQYRDNFNTLVTVNFRTKVQMLRYISDYVLSSIDKSVSTSLGFGELFSLKISSYSSNGR